MMALDLNSLVAVIQAFLKVPALHALAPTEKEPPFLVAQLIVLALFVLFTIVAAKKLRNDPIAA
jgi:hypothetical protein